VSFTPIQTIFWDIGGVLLTNGWDSRQRAHVLPALGVDLAAYEAVHDEVNYYWERGLITAQDFFEQTVIEANPCLNLTFEQIWPLVCGESKVLHPESFDILAALKTSGQYRLATINNESKELNAYRLDAFELRQYFGYFICSGYVHEMKPLPDIYNAAIGISGLPPETGLFIDDRQENCAAARA
jgi:FMN phosphatase YigB (HAD superfamily)